MFPILRFMRCSSRLHDPSTGAGSTATPMPRTARFRRAGVSEGYMQKTRRVSRREYSKSYRANVRLTRHLAETADEILGEQERLLGERAGALGVARVERVLGAGQETLDDPEILLLLPGELFRIHLAQQRLRPRHPVLRVAAEPRVLLGAHLRREDGRWRRGRRLRRRRRGAEGRVSGRD